MLINRAATAVAVVFAVAVSFILPLTSVAHAEERQPAASRVVTTDRCSDGSDPRIDQCHFIGYLDDWDVVQVNESEYLLKHRPTNKCLATDGGGFLLHWCSPNIAIERWRLVWSSEQGASYQSVPYPEVCVDVYFNRP